MTRPTGLDQAGPNSAPAEDSAPAREWPAVSVVMPVRNEEAHLGEAVAGVLEQGYPGELELVLALGPSTDATATIAAELAHQDRRVRVVPNPTGTTPAGLNVAIRASRHDIVVRVDGHGKLGAGYIRHAVELLDETGADNVGGIMAAEGETPFEQAVARAYTSPLGVGGARFHVGGGAGPAESVYLGVFRRATLDKLGGYDETYHRAQDWELNYRIRQAGGTIWFTPDLRVTYRPRSSLGALARQFYETGQWRRFLARHHPGTASPRYLAAPVALVGCVLGLGAGVVGLLAGLPWLTLGFGVPAGYLGGVLAGGIVVGHGLGLRARLWVPLVLSTMHLTWGLGFWTPGQALRSSRRRP